MPRPSTGRFERRIPRAVTIEVWPQDKPTDKKIAITVNVSPHGARVLMDREWRPGERLVLMAREEGLRSQAETGYCERLAGGRFGVGRELYVPVERCVKSLYTRSETH